MALKIVLINLLGVFFLSLPSAHAKDVSYANLLPQSDYQHILNNFLIRSGVDSAHFHWSILSGYQNLMMKLLTQTYIYSEIKSGHQLSAATMELYPHANPRNMLREIRRTLLKLNYLSMQSEIYYYEEARVPTVKMVVVAAQVITEASSSLNLRDKNLQNTLVPSFLKILKTLSGNEDSRLRIKRSSFEEAKMSIDQMSKALTPPNILKIITSKFKPAFSLSRPYQSEIGYTCSKIFQ